MNPPKTITIVTVTHAARFNYLSQLIDRVMRDPFVERLIVVSNGSRDIDRIEQAAREWAGRIEILALPQNVGSAKAFAAGLKKAGQTAAGFALLLDDDNVPEEGFGELYFKQLDTFNGTPEEGKVLILGNRHRLQGNTDVFINPPRKDHSYNKTFFIVFSAKKLKNFIGFFRPRKPEASSAKGGVLYPIVISETFAYGGTLIPMQAVRTVPMPDPRLALYGDDMVYSWNMKDAGYVMYVCARPLIEDLEISLDAEYHFLAFFKKETLEFKVFFKLRNSALLSVQYNPGKKAWIVCNIYTWVLGLFVIALVKLPWNRMLWSRMKLILEAVKRGIRQDYTIPKDLSIPESISLEVERR